MKEGGMDAYSRQSDLSRAVLSCRDVSQIPTTMLIPIGNILGATSSVCLRFDDLGNGEFRSDEPLYVGPSPNAVDAYLSGGYFRHDPVVTSEGSYDAEPAIRQLSSLREYCSERYTEGFLRPYNLGDVLALELRCDAPYGRYKACFGFHRSRDRPPFGTRERKLLQRVLPAIETTMLMLSSIETANLQHTALAVLTEQYSDMGLAILDEDLCLRLANARGLCHLGLGGEALTTGSIRLGRVRSALIDSNWQSGDLLPVSDSGVHMRSFRSRDNRSFHVLLSNSDGWGAGFPVLVEQQLTKRERELVSRLAMGESNAGIAAHLKISVRTVENHLRAIYSKLAVKSRMQLVARLRKYT